MALKLYNTPPAVVVSGLVQSIRMFTAYARTPFCSSHLHVPNSKHILIIIINVQAFFP